MRARLGEQDGRTGRGPAASSGQPWPGGETMVTETVVEQVVQALARGEDVSAIARAYGRSKNGPRVATARPVRHSHHPPDGVAARSVSGVDHPARAGGRL